jgi:hypothetical protein
LMHNEWKPADAEAAPAEWWWLDDGQALSICKCPTLPERIAIGGIH